MVVLAALVVLVVAVDSLVRVGMPHAAAPARASTVMLVQVVVGAPLVAEMVLEVLDQLVAAGAAVRE